MKVNGEYYHDVKLSPQMLLAINHVAGVLQQNVTDAAVSK